MEYAPIIIGTLCRFDHFKEAIESLERNSWAKYTNIYIGVDYPTKESHWDGYKKIINYINQHKFMFKSAKVLVREENFGAEKNYEDLRKVAFNENELIIMTEDDNVFSPNFIEYIDTMLNLYKDSKEVIGICGYSYPIKWNDYHSGYVLNENFFSAWGWATWKNKWEELESKITTGYFKEIVSNRKRLKKIRTLSPKSYYYLMRMVGKENIQTTDVTISIFMSDSDSYCVMPKLSMVRNCGWDGTGLNCDDKLAYDPQTQWIDTNFTIERPSVENIKLDRKNMEELNALFSVKGKEKLIPYLIDALVRIIGVDGYCKIRKRIKK